MARVFKVCIRIEITGTEPGQYAEAAKTYSFPFVPFPGLSVQLKEVTLNKESKRTSLAMSVKQHGLLAPGIVQMHEFLYNMRMKEFLTIVPLVLEKNQDFDATLEQIELLYGFVVWRA